MNDSAGKSLWFSIFSGESRSDPHPYLWYNKTDRGIKADLYQNMPSVQEILFVDTQIMRIQLYRRETGYWAMRNFIQDDTVELTSLHIQFSVTEAYEKTTFDSALADEE